MKLTKYLSVVAIAALFAACSGETGPAGPTGPAGTNGVSDLSAYTYTVTTQWSDPSNEQNWLSTWTSSSINDYNNDAVEVYWSNTGSAWAGLPATLNNNPGDQLSYYFSNGYVYFTYFTGGPSYINPPNNYTFSATLYFNVVVVPPSIQNRYPNKNWKNPNDVQYIPEVQAALNKNIGK
jgi:hypothetical protein